MLAPEPSSNNLFEDDNPYQLTTHLSWLLYVEVRKTSGEFYPSTLHLSLCALLQHIRGINNGFFGQKGITLSKSAWNAGYILPQAVCRWIGVQVKHTEILTEDEELKLWESEVIGAATPRGLQMLLSLSLARCFAGGTSLPESFTIEMKHHSRSVHIL